MEHALPVQITVKLWTLEVLFAVVWPTTFDPLPTHQVMAVQVMQSMRYKYLPNSILCDAVTFYSVLQIVG